MGKSFRVPERCGLESKSRSSRMQTGLLDLLRRSQVYPFMELALQNSSYFAVFKKMRIFVSGLWSI